MTEYDSQKSHCVIANVHTNIKMWHHDRTSLVTSINTLIWILSYYYRYTGQQVRRHGITRTTKLAQLYLENGRYLGLLPGQRTVAKVKVLLKHVFDNRRLISSLLSIVQWCLILDEEGIPIENQDWTETKPPNLTTVIWDSEINF